MASVYKPKKDKNNRSARWHYKYKDEHGKWKAGRGFTDKQETLDLARRLETEAKKRRDGLVDDRDLRLAEHRRMPIQDHIGAYEAALRAKGSSSDHIKQTIAYVEAARTDLGWKTLVDLSAECVQGWLAELRDSRGISARTLNARRTALRGFTRWCVRHGRLSTDPLLAVSPARESTDRRRTRRPIDLHMLNWLVAAAESGPVRKGISGRDRAMLYKLMAATGLRRGEASSVSARSFHLDGDEPYVVVEAAHSKRRRQDEQPIPHALAQEIKSWIEGVSQKGRLWPLPDKAFKYILLPDLRRARALWMRSTSNRLERRERLRSDFLKPVDDNGHVVDFHSFRHGSVTQLVASGTLVPVAQRLARHSDPALTLGTYSHFGLADDRAALEEAYQQARTESAPQRIVSLSATGTEGPPGRAPNAHHGRCFGVPSRAQTCNEASAGPISSNSGKTASGVRKTPLSDAERRFVPNTGEGSRTPNLLIRSQVLYPIELRPLYWDPILYGSGGWSARSPRGKMGGCWCATCRISRQRHNTGLPRETDVWVGVGNLFLPRARFCEIHRLQELPSMASSISSKKRIRQNIKHRARNRWRLRIMRGAVKDFEQKVAHGTTEEARESFRVVCRVLDRTAQKGVIHRNTAARKKSRLNRRLKAKAG